jgi:hypothetical protein
MRSVAVGIGAAIVLAMAMAGCSNANERSDGPRKKICGTWIGRATSVMGSGPGTSRHLRRDLLRSALSPDPVRPGCGSIQSASEASGPHSPHAGSLPSMVRSPDRTVDLWPFLSGPSLRAQHRFSTRKGR